AINGVGGVPARVRRPPDYRLLPVGRPAPIRARGRSVLQAVGAGLPAHHGPGRQAKSPRGRVVQRGQPSDAAKNNTRYELGRCGQAAPTHGMKPTFARTGPPYHTIQAPKRSSAGDAMYGARKGLRREWHFHSCKSWGDRAL